jgi:hypothetical protein
VGKQPGFYLIMAMGSEQAGLTGVKGSNRPKDRSRPVGLQSPKRADQHQKNPGGPLKFDRRVSLRRDFTGQQKDGSSNNTTYSF